ACPVRHCPSFRPVQLRSWLASPRHSPFKCLRAPLRAEREDNPANERLEQGDPADPGAERVDETILGCGQARCSGIAALSELWPFPAPPLRDLYPMRLDGPEIRARERCRDNPRLHHHVP